MSKIRIIKKKNEYSMEYDIRDIFKITLLVLFLLIAAIFCEKRQKQSGPLTVAGFKLNTIVNITLYEPKEEALLQEAMALCDKYEKIFSRTRLDSELSQLNAGTLSKEGEWYLLSPELAEVVKKGLYYSKLSEGAFDITIEPLSSLWDFTLDEPEIPALQELEEAKKRVGYESVIQDGNRLRFKKENMGLELGGIAKGYIADQIKGFLMEHGVKSAIIDLGGNIVCIGKKQEEPFTIGIQKPFAKRNETITEVKIENGSVVSSGVYERYFEKDGTCYHHILNPQTGYPYENNLSSVTILSKSSMDADALSTVCFALGLKAGMKLIDQIPDTQAIFITEDGCLHYSRNYTRTHE